MRKLLLALATAAALAGCGQKSTPVAGDAGTSPAPTAPDAPAAPSEADLDQAAVATQESAGTTPAPADTSLERLVTMPAATQLPGGRWQAGRHYRPIVPAQATNVSAGQVEVIEFLWLACAGCYELNPRITAWKAQLPEWVKFRQEHVMWGPSHRELGRLLYTLDVLGRNDLVPAAFEEIHRKGNMLVSNNQAKTEEMQLAFARAHGIEAEFKREYKGFGVTKRLTEAEELGRRYPIDQTPAFVVNGKYYTDNGMAGGTVALLELLGDLAAAEKR